MAKTMSSAAHIGSARASAAATAASPKPSAKSPKTPAAIDMPIPTPRAATLRLTSRRASSSSRRASVLACSATCLAAGPTPCSASWVGMTSPVEHLGEDDACDERRTDNEKRARPTPAALRLRGRWSDHGS